MSFPSKKDLKYVNDESTEFDVVALVEDLYSKHIDVEVEDDNHVDYNQRRCSVNGGNDDEEEAIVRSSAILSSTASPQNIDDSLFIEYLKSRGFTRIVDEFNDALKDVHERRSSPNNNLSATMNESEEAFNNNSTTANADKLVDGRTNNKRDTLRTNNRADTSSRNDVPGMRRTPIRRSCLGVGAFAIGESIDETESVSNSFRSSSLDATGKTFTEDDDVEEVPLSKSESLQAMRVDDIVEVTASPLKENTSKWTRKMIYTLLLGTSLILVAVIILSVLLSQKHNRQDNFEESIPTMSPTISPESRLKIITDIVSTISDVESTSPIFLNEQSPQYKALQWIAINDKNHVDVTDIDRIIQRYVLGILYYTTGGDTTWIEQYEFLTDDNECAWSGALQCDTNGYITDIDLRENNLQGPIPHELNALSKLESLILDSNDITGTIPNILGTVTTLRRLNVWDNQLIGTIPIDMYFEQLTNLESLRLGRNILSGTISNKMYQLTKLTHLSLEKNIFTGTLPDTIWSSLSNMEKFEISQQKFQGTISSDIGKWLNLTSLVTHNCLLSGTIPTEIGLLTNIKNFQLAANHLTGTLPTEISNLIKLSKLSLSYNFFTGTLPYEYLQLTNVRAMYFQNTRLSGNFNFVCNAIKQNKFGPLDIFRADLFDVNCTCCNCCAY